MWDQEGGQKSWIVISNLAEISSTTALSDDKEKQAAPCTIYQNVCYSLANLTEPNTLKWCSFGGGARKFALPSFKLQCGGKEVNWELYTRIYPWR